MFPPALFRVIACAAAFVAAMQGPVPSGRPVSLDDALRAAGEYVAEYERQILQTELFIDTMTRTGLLTSLIEVGGAPRHS